jgi:hypothetical protein
MVVLIFLFMIHWTLLKLRIYNHMARDVNEAKLPVSSLGLGPIRLGSCATRLLNELLVDTKLYSIIKRYIPV